MEKDVKSAKGGLADSMAREANAQADARDNLKIQSLRVTERYGSNGNEREKARKEADALEDNRAKQARAKELGKDISDPDKANKIADIEVRRERIVKDAEREGTPPASQMARMGGSSGFAGVVNDSQAIQKKIADLNEKQAAALASMKEKNDQIFPLVMSLLKDNQ